MAGQEPSGSAGSRTSTHELGALAEARARRHYRLRGYTILAANVRSGGIELDIVCRRGRQLVVCEVKDKRDGRYGDPLEMVDDRKQERLRRGAEAWLQSHPEHRELDLRFDVVAVRGTKLERVEHAF